MTDPISTQICRRTFTAATAAVVSGAFLSPLVLSRAVRAQGGQELAISEITPNMHIITGQGGNALVAVGDGGSLLIDCKVTGAGEALRELADSAGVPVAAVINTHHHGDHTGGNPAFTPDLPVYAHPACAGHVRAQVASRGNDPTPFLPTHEVQNTQTLEVAGLSADLRHAGAGHTDNDVFVFFKDANVLHTGDLLFHKLHPYMDPPVGSTSTGWIASCKAMLELCDDETIVVPGHGDVTDRTGIEGQIAYFTAVRDAVAELVHDGKSKSDAEGLDLPIFEGLGFGQLRGRVLSSIYEEFVAEGH